MKIPYENLDATDRLVKLELLANLHETEAERIEALDSDGECMVAADFHATRASELRAAIANMQ